MKQNMEKNESSTEIKSGICDELILSVIIGIWPDLPYNKLLQNVITMEMVLRMRFLCFLFMLLTIHRPRPLPRPLVDQSF